jgi:hypothetical protein
MRKYTIPSDLIQVKSVQPVVYKQYDNGDNLEVELFQDGDKINLTNETVLAFFQLEDDTVIEKTCTIKNGNAVATLDNNVLSQQGKLKVEFTIYDGEKETTTRTILITVEPSINRNEAIETIPEWDIVQQVLDFKPSLESLILDTEIAVQYATESAEYAQTQGDYVESKKPIIDKFTGDQTNLQAQIDSLVIGGDSSPEAAQARVNKSGTVYATLKARLDDENTKIAASLAEKATQAYVKNLNNALAYTRDVNYSYVQNKMQNFITHYKNRDKNLVLLMWGDSISARDMHTTYYSANEIAHRPPLMDSKNLCGLLWDRLNWKNTEYRRFDAVDNGVPVFTEYYGTFRTVNTSNYSTENASWALNWNDIISRNAVTRFIGGSSLKQISFKIKQNVQVCNFIYRAGASCAQTVKLFVNEGFGKVQVFDETSQTWKEASNYAFSMKDTKNVYQKRLKLRCKDDSTFDTTATEKTVFVIREDGVTGHLSYWGIEYSNDPYIFTLINSARGAHDIESLEAFIQEDVFDRNPDLTLFQIPIMNMGVQYENPHDPQYNVSRIQNTIYNTTNPNSLISKWGNFEERNVVCWIPHFSVHGLGLNELTGEWKKWTPANNTAYGEVDVRDYYHAFYDYFDSHKDIPFINLFDKVLVDGMNINQNLFEAFKASGVTEKTFTNDGTHQNDTGTKLLSKHLFPVFEF